MHVIEELLSLITNSAHLLVPFTHVHPHLTELIDKCKTAALETKSVSQTNEREIDYVLRYLHDHLNIGRWDEVEEHKRQAFTSASYLKTLIILQLNSSFRREKNVEVVRSALQVVDKGFLLGLPLRDNLSLLTDCASLLTKFVNRETCQNVKPNQTSEQEQVSQCKRIKFEHEYKVSVNGNQVNVLDCPSIELFKKEHFDKQTPAVIRDCMTVWPAMSRWVDVNYLLKVGGERTVPIEIGSSYSSEDFSQKLMTLNEFVRKYYDAKDGEEIGYLAQHDLLTQIPELINDVKVPDYCCLRRKPTDDEEDDAEPEINAWLGPKGTVSSLHFDPKDNLLCQVYGSKQVILVAPSDSKYLYAHDDMPMLSNTSQVDPANPDYSKFAEFKHATLHACVLKPGEMLYIPPRWWHHVTALEKSFSVNFWWE